MSAAAKLVLNEIGAELHQVPARSPSVNRIENIFNIVRSLQIVRESFEEFKSLVIRCFDCIDSEVIDCTIRSMPKRIKQIIALKDATIKY